jgi:hypothetical protein
MAARARKSATTVSLFATDSAIALRASGAAPSPSFA